MMMMVQPPGMCCQKPSAQMVKQPAVSSTKLSHCPTEGTVLMTDMPRESRVGMPHCPRKVASSRLPRSPLLGQGEGTSPPAPSTCAPRRPQSLGLPETSARSRKRCPKEQKGQGWEAGGRDGTRRRVAYLGPQTP